MEYFIKIQQLAASFAFLRQIEEGRTQLAINHPDRLLHRSMAFAAFPVRRDKLDLRHVAKLQVDNFDSKTDLSDKKSKTGLQMKKLLFIYQPKARRAGSLFASDYRNSSIFPRVYCKKA
ncbi:MAG TPA: hypothetical protein VM123_03225, partial [archaeon]|nr:hypothetical protein [archaeon]